MGKLIAIISFFLLFSGCKKTIDKIKENAVISAMTDGQWVIKKFIRNGTNITPDFAAYKFQFHSNKTVDAINNSTVEKTGSWDGDANTMTITAEFSNVVLPLILINGSWHIDNNSWTYVAAFQNSGTETKILRLEKL